MAAAQCALVVSALLGVIGTLLMTAKPQLRRRQRRADYRIALGRFGRRQKIGTWLICAGFVIQMSAFFVL
jgi:hypothetical protein